MDASQSQSPSADSSQATARQQPQQQQQQPGGQSLVVVSSSGGSSSIPLVNSISSGSANTVVLSAQNAMAANTAQLMTQAAAGVPQNSIRLPIQQQQQHLIMAPMNNLMFGNYLQGGHPVLTQGTNQYIIQNLPTMQNQSIFQLPPHSQNITTISGRRSTVTNAQNIQPRPQSQLLPAPLSQQVYRTNLSQQIIAQSSGVNTTPANIQPRPQSFLHTSPMIRAANITPQLFAPQSFQQVFSQNQPAGLCWTGQAGANSGFILRSQNEPIQFLQAQTPLQIPFVQNNVQVPSAPAPVVAPAATAAVQATTQVTTSANSTPVRIKPIAMRPASSSTSTSMGTQTAPRTTTTVADVSKNHIRPKLASGPGRPVTVTPSPSSKLVNGPVAAVQVREAEASATRPSPAITAPLPPPLMKSDVSSSNAATSHTADQKGDGKLVKASPVPPVSGKKDNHKEGIADRIPPVRRSGEKRDAPVGHENMANMTNFPGPGKKSESLRLKNGVKSVNECKKTPAEPERAAPDILIHVIEDYVIEESSKPFPVNGTADPSHCENGSSRSDGISNRSDSPEEIISTPRARLPSDAGECQRCQNTGSKSRLKLRNGMRVCAPCLSSLSKRPASKLDLFNPVTSCLSEYDFPGTDVQPAAKGTPVPEPDVVSASDNRKKARLSKKGTAGADVQVSWMDFLGSQELKTMLPSCRIRQSRLSHFRVPILGCQLSHQHRHQIQPVPA